MIEIRRLTKCYDRKAILNNLDGNFEEGLVHGILGPNGCGKTTLIKSMLGLVQPEAGEVFFRGAPLQSRRESISWLPQHPQAPSTTTPHQLFLFIEKLRGQPAVLRDQLVRQFGFTAELEKPLSALSGGNHQKCFLIATLMFGSPLIILDEPTVGLDPVAAATFKKILKGRPPGTTVLLISHITSEIAQLSDKVHFLLEGRWAFHGFLDEIKADSQFTDFESFIVQKISSNGGPREPV